MSLRPLGMHDEDASNIVRKLTARCSALINNGLVGKGSRVSALEMRTPDRNIPKLLLRASADPAGASTPDGVSPSLAFRAHNRELCAPYHRCR
jgi:hypothetical protein